MTASTKEKAAAEAAAPEAKGGKKKLIIILLVVLLAAGGGAYFFLFAGSAKAAAPTPGAVMDVTPVAVNLAGGGYLKVGVAMQLTSSVDPKAEPDPAKATDLIISTFSGAAPADVTSARDALKAALLAKIEKAYGKDVVMGIYYTDYVTQ
jgi:flagellar FliL protein